MDEYDPNNNVASTIDELTAFNNHHICDFTITLAEETIY
jgi:hypothetical protein